MFKCNDCQHTFAEPLYVKERDMIDTEMGSRPITYTAELCPKCQGQRIVLEEPKKEIPVMGDDYFGDCKNCVDW
jgi:hypothetical protein